MGKLKVYGSFTHTTAMTTQAKGQDDILQEFKELVNMTPQQIEKWLDTEESKKVGFRHEGEDESVGHQSGKKIIHILRTKKAELKDEDYAHVHKVVSYIKRHSAQRPDGEVEHTNWRYSLMNWGHDPLKH